MLPTKLEQDARLNEFYSFIQVVSPRLLGGTANIGLLYSGTI
jgi:hypothetical protein